MVKWQIVVLITLILALFHSVESSAAQSVKPFQISRTTDSDIRIVALSPHAVELLFSLGVGRNIVGTVEHANYPDDARHIPRIGSHNGISVEQIVKLKPDLIVTWSSGIKPAQLTQLKQLGFTLYDSNPKVLDDIATDLTALGKLTYAQNAVPLVEQFKRDLAKLRAENAKKAPISVYYQLWHQPLMSVSKNSWIHQYIDTCNGKNIFADAPADYPQISAESIIAKKPQVILVSNTDSTPSNKRGLWDSWVQIPAVEHQQIYPLPSDLLHRQTLRSIKGIKTVCNKLDRARRIYGKHH